MLLSVATASPQRTLTQAQWWQFFQQWPHAPLTPRSLTLLNKILHGSSGIHHRHSATDPQEFKTWSAEKSSRTFEKHAPALAAQAILTALDQAQLNPKDLHALLLCTCTGALCPGPSTHVAEILNTRPNIHLADLTGFGCAAAIPTLHQASAYLALHPSHALALVAVELCSTTFLIDDDPAQLISLCLFGDGAAALILCGPEHPAHTRSLGHFSHFKSHLDPRSREQIRLAPAPLGLQRNQLSRAVPQLAAQAVKTLHDQRPHPETPRKILSHGGGRDVLNALRQALPHHPLTEAQTILQNHGNLSSPSLFYALQLALQQDPQNQAYWLTGFGAGFSAHSCNYTPK